MASLQADLIDEDDRSVTGPLPGSTGASATVVGTTTGIGELATLQVRPVMPPRPVQGGVPVRDRGTLVQSSRTGCPLEAQARRIPISAAEWEKGRVRHRSLGRRRSSSLSGPLR